MLGLHNKFLAQHDKRPQIPTNTHIQLTETVEKKRFKNERSPDFPTQSLALCSETSFPDHLNNHPFPHLPGKDMAPDLDPLRPAPGTETTTCRPVFSEENRPGSP